ncbi:MAG: nicotinamide-nucleotide amidohydrolase family protein [Bacteroidia bacterium]|nr:nicotinamide-nucleotide amidohydrolase family protein [Bacteroidia bacterium]MDW8235984.1 nicotinamide-nucleotide amidohydrolase family protein [Bacteroidia bacterium]
MSALRAWLLLIGDELTQGRLADKNGTFLAAQLTSMGFRIEHIQTLPDDEELLREEMRRAVHSEAAVVLSSGGLGHTTDDLTAQSWAEVMQDNLVIEPSLLENLQQRVAQRGHSTLPYLERYALVPQKGGYFPNPVGLAPALYWDRERQFICALPGPPLELQSLWQSYIQPFLQQKFAPVALPRHTFRTTGITESGLSALLSEWERALPPSLRLSYNPAWEGVSLYLQARQPIASEEFAYYQSTLRQKIEPYLYAEGETSLAEALLAHLRSRGWHLATAESCTGGHIAAAIVDIPGASEVFWGSIVAYDNSVKIHPLGVSPEVLQKEGAVSESVARQMAKGVAHALGTEVGIATTGIAGPTGGTPEKPVGTVWIAIHTPDETMAKKFVFSGGRTAVITRATATALSLTWQALSKYFQKVSS